MGLADAGALEIALLAAGLAAAGALAGLLAGLFGVGGGIVLVPVLDQVLAGTGVDPAVRMHVAVATSLATVIATSLRSVRAHDAKGAVDWEVLALWAPGVFAGSLLAGALAGLISGDGLRLVFGSVALALAVWMAFAPPRWVIGQGIPRNPLSHAVAGAIGLVSVLMGIGGGTFAVTAQTLYGVAIHRAIGTASGLGVVIAVPGTMGLVWGGWGDSRLPPLSLGYVNLLGLLVIVPATTLVAPWGAWLAHRLPQRALRVSFAVFLAVAGARILWRAFA